MIFTIQDEDLGAILELDLAKLAAIGFPSGDGNSVRLFTDGGPIDVEMLDSELSRLRVQWQVSSGTPELLAGAIEQLAGAFRHLVGKDLVWNEEVNVLATAIAGLILRSGRR